MEGSVWRALRLDAENARRRLVARLTALLIRHDLADTAAFGLLDDESKAAALRSHVGLLCADPTRTVPEEIQRLAALLSSVEEMHAKFEERA